VIADIESSTSYRFLYRDALVAGLSVSFSSSQADLLDGFNLALHKHRLQLEVTEGRDMVFIIPVGRSDVSQPVIRGTVSDALSLERLPHATIAWRGPGGTQGVVSDDAGRFIAELGTASSPILIVASFLGYNPDSLFIDLRRPPFDLAIKLLPKVVVGSEIVVSSALLSSNLDSTWHYLLRASLATPAGEESVSRALQMLPAVGLTTAVSSGLNVRGSRTDGFQILLDGMPIYNPSHLYGMFDAFNPDALQAVDFYYAVAPARFQAPPGGTLSYLTRSGSKQRIRSTVGLSTTAVSATVEGPLNFGSAGWIISARRSYIDEVNWFNNPELIEIGLGVSRDNSGTRRLSLDQRTLFPGSPSATFYDVHAKFDHESSQGASFQISAYAGGDWTSQDGERITNLRPGNQNPRVRTQVSTTSDWGNVAFSAHHRTAVRPWGYGHTYLGLTRFHSSYRKDDFLYRRLPVNAEAFQLQFAPFLNNNSLLEVRLAHESFLHPSPALAASIGFSAQRLASVYDELSALRREFESDRNALQLDLFGELTARARDWSLTLGARPQYYSAGHYLRISPRITLSGLTRSRLSLSAGYTRSYQFTHNLYIESESGPSIWTLSNEQEPPGAVDHLTASLLYRTPSLTLQAEGFLKWHDNLRRHETVIRPAGLRDEAVLLSPWTHDNEARARGLELLLSRRVAHAVLTATYALSRSEIRHPAVNEGAYFSAEWDRPHTFAFHSQIDLVSSLSFSSVLSIASGQPNTLSYINDALPARHETYNRVDLAFHYHTTLASSTLEAYFRLYNVFDRQNTWYATAETVIAGSSPNLALAFEPVNVYDLGLTPTIGLSLAF
jgi:hypothetical protein